MYKKTLYLATLLAVTFGAADGFAQTAEEPTTQPTEKTVDGKKDGKKKPTKDGEKKKGEKEEDAKADQPEEVKGTGTPVDATGKTLSDAPTTQPVEPVEPVEPVDTKPDVVEVDPDNPFGDSPISELADKDFVPLDDIDEGDLEQIIPARIHPRIEWDGSFRVRGGVSVNYDLDTRGTSAVVPPIESYAPAAIADAEKDSRWGTNMNLRLDPTFHITEELRIHSELGILSNVGFGSLPSSRLGFNDLGNIADGSQLSPREREFFGDAIQVRELYGEIDTLFATVSMGRMDEHWGLGALLNDGDCDDCNAGSTIDRLQILTKVWEFYGQASWDFPDEGPTSRNPLNPVGQPYDLSQIDDADQWTLSVFRKALTREERELQHKSLLDDDEIVLNGGLLYRYKTQSGAFSPFYDGQAFDPAAPATLIYEGLNTHTFDLWLELLFEPDYKQSIRVGLEAIATFGNIDNTSGEPVGVFDPNGSDTPGNCFNADFFASNERRCTSDVDGDPTNQSFGQFGLALETEFKFDSPVVFGVNGGFATGGDTPNWGTSENPDLNFMRFNSDYQVDLILFREVIGTVTNAWYANPYASVSFLESTRRNMEFRVDGILSQAINEEGTPSGISPWLGFELDGALKYIMHDTFTASLEAGILFPFDGLAGVDGRPRYTLFGSNGETFTDAQPLDPSIAWTIQSKFVWNF